MDDYFDMDSNDFSSSDINDDSESELGHDFTSDGVTDSSVDFDSDASSDAETNFDGNSGEDLNSGFDEIKSDETETDVADDVDNISESLNDFENRESSYENNENIHESNSEEVSEIGGKIDDSNSSEFDSTSGKEEIDIDSGLDKKTDIDFNDGASEEVVDVPDVYDDTSDSDDLSKVADEKPNSATSDISKPTAVEEVLADTETEIGTTSETNPEDSTYNFESNADDNDTTNPYYRCPKENGQWDGGYERRGETKWIPNRDYVPPNGKGINNPDAKTMGEIMGKYGIDGIRYKNGQPDFSEMRHGEPVEIERFSDDRKKNYIQAERAYAERYNIKNPDNPISPDDVKKYRESNSLTWHERRDCTTMELVPREIHGNCSHSGGVAEYKRRRKNNERQYFRNSNI